VRQKIIVTLVASLALAVFVMGCVTISEDKHSVNQTGATILCDKEQNCCINSDDCEYIWYTWGCNTADYVAKKQKEAKEQRTLIGEAPRRENVTCSCENNICITHN